MSIPNIDLVAKCYNSSVNYNTWLMDKFVKWERERKQRQSYSAFARYLGVKQSSLSQWLAGNYPPSKENVEKIAAKLGPEIYDIMGMQRPDPELEHLREQFEAVDPKDRQEVLKLIEETLREHGYVKKKPEAGPIPGKSHQKSP